MKYSEWLAKQNGTSWKQQLAADIDKLVLREDVQSVSDLADKLKEQGYTVRSGKYLSVKAPKQKNAIRSYRLGDGYSVDDLQYRILHKEREISLTAIQRYSGVQREYAFCMRQMQIAVFTKKPKRATYSDLQKSAELLNYLSSNNITSANELENRLNAAAENYQNSVLKKKELSSQIEKVEKIIADGKRYLSLIDKDFLTAEEKEEYKKVSYIEKMGINSFADVEQRKQNVDSLKRELAELEVTVEKQKKNEIIFRDYSERISVTLKIIRMKNWGGSLKRSSRSSKPNRNSRKNIKIERNGKVGNVKAIKECKFALKNRLKEIRRKKGLTQKQFAEMINVSRQTISAIETEYSIPTARLALIICNALDKKFEELFYFK